MKRNVMGMFALAILSLSAVGAYAQSTIQATVPFAFRVGTAHLPAGTYRISRANSSTIIRLSNVKGSVSAMALCQPASPSKTTSKLVFRHVGNQYALTNIWGEAGSQGMSFYVPKMDSEKVAVVTPKWQTGNEVLIALNK